MSLGNDNKVPHELLERIDALFNTSAKHVSGTLDNIHEDQWLIPHDLRYVIPELPESAEYDWSWSLPAGEHQMRSQKFLKAMSDFVLKKTLLSEDFSFDYVTKELEIREMAVVQLHAQKRSYIGSLAIRGKQYPIPEGNSIYNISKTRWDDWHPGKEFELTLITPHQEIFSNLNEAGTFLTSRHMSQEEELVRLRQLDETLSSFGY